MTLQKIKHTYDVVRQNSVFRAFSGCLMVSRIAALHILLGGAFAFFYSQLTIPEFNEFRLRIEDIRGEAGFELPAEETYLLKIWGDDLIEKITVNAIPVPHSIFRSRTMLREFYYILPKDCVRKGENTIKIFPSRRCSLRIKNCISATNFGVILPKNATVQPPGLSPAAAAKIVLLFSVVGTLFLRGMINFFSLSFEKAFWRYVFSYLPCFGFLGAVWKASFFLPFEIYFLQASFIKLCLLLFAIVQIPLLLSLVLKDGIIYSRKASTKLSALIGDAIITSSKNIVKRVADHPAAQWWKHRQFGDKCITTFFILFFVTMAFLASGFEFLAEIIANIAYLALTTAVVIKLKKSRDAAEDV